MTIGACGRLGQVVEAFQVQEKALKDIYTFLSSLDQRLGMSKNATKTGSGGVSQILSREVSRLSLSLSVMDTSTSVDSSTP